MTGVRALALVLMLAAAPAAPAAAGDTTSAYVVPAGGKQITTLRAAKADISYRLVVTGVYSYGDGAGLADCSYFSKPDGSNLDGTWSGNSQFRINGFATKCGEYQPDHVYEFDYVGQGRPLTFDVFDLGGRGDNAGALVVTITPAL